jgi:hypothetical protein
MRMIEHVELIHLLENPAALRLWLLEQALRSVPLEAAVELARTAEAFLMGSEVETVTDDPATVLRRGQDPCEPTRQSVSKAGPADREPARGGSPLTENQRDRLLERLAEGARNAELVAEFGISPKQIQGIRMGCNREIAKRRIRLADKSSEPATQHQAANETASIDEIVRYLRQQDDVVVSQEDGWYLVNGRFRMSVAELAARANRIRSRQQKPAFQIPTADLQLRASSGQKRHPLFWDAALPQRGPNGFRQPPDNDTEGA